MRSKIFSVAAIGVLLVTSLSGCSAVAARYQAFSGDHKTQDADPISGGWNVTFNDNGTPLPATFELRLKGATVAGTVYSEKTGEGTIRDGKWVNGKLSFAVYFKEHKSLVVEGFLKEGKLLGECHHPEGPTYKWEATRK